MKKIGFKAICMAAMLGGLTAASPPPIITITGNKLDQGAITNLHGSDFLQTLRWFG